MSDDEQMSLPEPYVAPRRRPFATFALLAVVIAATGWEFATYGLSPSSANLARAGGSSLGSLANNSWWKLITANFLHVSLIHVAANSLVLLIIGSVLERELGRRVFLGVVAWSLIGTSIGSLVVGGAAVSVGASGICFALMGAAIVADPHRRTPLGVQAWGLLLINIIFTFAVPGISIGGHVGGLVAGLLVGYIACTRHASPKSPHVVGMVLATGGAACVALAALPALLAHTAPATINHLNVALVRPGLEHQLATKLRSGNQVLDVSSATCQSATGDAVTWDCRLTIAGQVQPLTFAYDATDQWKGRRR